MNIIGFDHNNHTEESVSRALSSGRFPHAVIIEGGLPEERLALSKKIASTLLCDDDETLPCGECNHCRKTSLEIHPDVLIYKPRKKEGSKNENYYVDYIREIRDSAFIIPNESDLKIYILTEAQLMNEQGQNAFLKILEEPPKYAVFILLTTSSSVFLQTILSRVTVFTLGGEVRDNKEDVPYEKAFAAAESVAQSLTLDSRLEIVKAAGVFDKDSKLFAAALPLLSEIFINALKVKFSAADSDALPSVCRDLAIKLSRTTLLRLIDDVNILSDALRQNANLNLTITRLCTLFESA